jgi:DNA transformation protein and related proteins
MAVTPSYKAYVLEQLTGPGPVSARAMFGGVGLYCQGLFFALIDNDTVYLKVDDVTRGDFERLGSGAFRPYGDESPTMQYYELPAEILEDREAARPWVARALEVARRAAARKAAGKRSR